MKIKSMKTFIFASVLALGFNVTGMVSNAAETNSENIVSEPMVVNETVLEEPVSGVDGGLDWQIDTNGHLTISGTGNYETRVAETTKGWLVYKDEIKTATVNVTGITDTRYMFYGCSNLTSLDISKFDTSQVTKMDWMFCGCKSLINLDVSNLVTNDVMEMDWMFSGCSRLTSLDLSNWNTSKVTNMNCMFYNCSGLASLNVSGLNVQSVTDMGSMFNGCSGLTSLDLSRWDTSQVTNIGSMFGGCSSLTSLNLSGWNTSLVTSMANVFNNCSGLTSLDISEWDTSQVTDMYRMFYDCKGLVSLEVGEWKIDNVSSMSDMFYGCDSLTQLIAPQNTSSKNMVLPSGNYYWEHEKTGEITTKVTNAGVYKRYDLEEGETKPQRGKDGALDWMIDTKGHLTISGNGDFLLDENKIEPDWLTYKNDIKSATVNVTGTRNTSYMFNGCINLKSVDVSGLDTSQVTNMCWMFFGCANLQSLDLRNFETTSVRDMSYMFYGCINLKSLNISNFETTTATNMESMFEGCSNLQSLELSKFDTSAVTNMSRMFNGCTNLVILIAPENKSLIEMPLPSIPNNIWKYESTGEIVTNVTKAGTYIREKQSETPEGGNNTGETPETPGGGNGTGETPGTPGGGNGTVETPGAENGTVETPGGGSSTPVTPEIPGSGTPSIETIVKNNADGSVTKIEKITQLSGEITQKIISTSKDQKKETIVDMKISASGQIKDVAIEVVYVVKSSKMTINLDELKAMVDKTSSGNIDYIYPVGSRTFDLSKTLAVSQKKANVSIKVSAKSTSGKKKYTVAIKNKDLTKKKFVVYASDKKNNAVMVNTKKNTATVSKKNNLTLKIAKSGNYQLQNSKDAAKTDKKILKTVKPKKATVTVKKGKTASFSLAKNCNKDNISKISYSSNNSKVKVTKKGKIQAKASGTSKITATVTMKNGQKKKVSMKVKVS